MKNFRQLLYFAGIPSGMSPICRRISLYGGRLVNTPACAQCTVLNHHTNRLNIYHHTRLVDGNKYPSIVSFQCFSHNLANSVLVSRTRLSSDIREYSTGENSGNDKNDGNAAQTELKGVVVHVPNPLLWMKNKWYSYLIRFSVDPAFNLDEFLIGAKQALSYLTRLIVQKDFETLNAVSSVEAVETVKQLIAPWTPDQQHSIEVLVEDITLASASIAALTKNKDSQFVHIDVLCIAVKRFKSRPLLIQMTVRFQREYGKHTSTDWFINSINEFVVREMNASKSSDQQPN